MRAIVIPLGICMTLLGPSVSSFAAIYAPLKTKPDAISTQLLTIRDAKRNRSIPVKAYLPATAAAAPVILFSHGLGGNREGSGYLGDHWAKRGYACIFLQHPGSDDAVWKDTALLKRMAAMKKAASSENFSLRVNDISAVLDQLEKWNAQTDHPLAKRLNLKTIGMSGHSFGAVTTQAVSGQSYGFRGRRFTDSRITAAVIMSPSTPRIGDAGRAFGAVNIPWMLMTGTQDLSPIGNADMKSRLGVYPELPNQIDRYQLVLHDGLHSAFTERGLPGDRGRRNPNHHKVILALSTAFWDSYLKGSPEAKQWLQRKQLPKTLEAKDRWEFAKAESSR